MYTAVFTRYLGTILARGHSIEYFIEGGRSRTGRLLQPKTGMLAMTVRGYVRTPERPVVFVPVYFGYERLVEGRTYIGELSGQPKEKESVFGMLRTLPELRSRFGKVYVSFGEPLPLQTLLARHAPHWSPGIVVAEEKPSWLAPLCDDLARYVTYPTSCSGCVRTRDSSTASTAHFRRTRPARREPTRSFFRGSSCSRSDVDDDLAAGVALLEVRERLRDLGERVAPVDHGRDVARLDQRLHGLEVLRVRLHREADHLLAHER